MRPGKLDLPTIWRGCDWPRIVLNWKDHNGQPFDLTGWNPKATTTSNYDLRAAVLDPVNGVTQLGLTHTDTADFTLGVQSWDWIWENLTPGQVPLRYPPFLYGKVVIKEPVTMDPPPSPLAPPPPNDLFANAIAITGTTGSLSGTTINATREPGEPDGQNTVWYKLFTAGGDKEAEFYIDSFFLTIDVYRQANPTDGVGDLEFVVTSGTNNPSRVQWHAFAGRTYYIRLRKRSVSSDFVLVWVLHPPQPPNPPSNDSFYSAVFLGVDKLQGSINGTTLGATEETGEPDGTHSVWYRWRSPASEVIMNFSLNNNVNKISIYLDNDPAVPDVANLIHVATSVSNPPVVTFTTIPNRQYRIRVYKNTGTTNFKMNWNFSI